MVGKMSMTRIIRSHYQTLEYGRSGKTDWWQVFVYLCSPFLLGAWMAWRIELTKDLANGLITTLSIFAGLLLNLLLLVHGLIDKEKGNEHPNDHRISWMHSLFSNISFATFICVASTAVLVGSLAGLVRWQGLISWVGFSLSMMAGMTLLMILKRIHDVVEDDIKN